MLPSTAALCTVLVIVATLASPVAGQTDLEALYSLTLNVTNKDPSWNIKVPACQWKGVLCNATGSVVQIIWELMGLGGYPNLATLPQGLQQLLLSSNKLTGTPNLAALPQGLEGLHLDANHFTGTPNLETLPQGLQELDLSFNQFKGSGMFSSGAVWCPSSGVEKNMCGVGVNGTFNCIKGLWEC